MGDDAVGGVASDRQIAAMRSLLHESLEAGGLGLSSSWTPAHRDADGRTVPSRSATAEELVELARVVRGVPGTTLEFVPGLAGFGDSAFDMMVEMSLAGDRPINWNVIRVVDPAARSPRCWTPPTERLRVARGSWRSPIRCCPGS
jgi:N-acyl-D-aspartate/D-glutamate deacylase